MTSSTFENKLKNKFHGQKCLLLACGPSINELTREQINDFAGNNPIFCIKQTIDIVDRCDIHFWNCSNMPQWHRGVFYDYEKMGKNPIVIASSNYSLGTRWKPQQYHDFFFRIPSDINRSVSVQKNFDDYLFEKTMKRPCGPGIMLETVLYTIIYTGIKEIVTLGWDLNKKGDQDHYHSFKIVNRGSFVQKEIEDSIKATEDVYFWLRDKGITIKTLSKQSKICPKIERISL